MAESDCATVDVTLAGVDTQLVDHRHGLCSEGFVQLEQVDTIQRPFGFGDGFANGLDWA
jgi:hypothetical protein